MADWEHKVTFDPPEYMKTTRLDVFKMRPAFFPLQPRRQQVIQLLCTGCPEGVKPNLKDRYSVLMAIVPEDAPADWDAEKMWEDQKMQLELEDSVKRKILKIHYEGYPIPAYTLEDIKNKRKNKKNAPSCCML